MAARTGAPAPARSGGGAHRALICLNVGLATAVLVAGAVYGYARYRLDQIHRVALASAPAGSGPSAAPLVDEAPGQPFNLVLVGSDSRVFVANAADRQRFGDTSVVDGQRSDTLMVVHVDPGARTARVLSIHRDLYVPVSGTRGSAKINSALEKGPAALLNTLRDDLGIAASHFVQLDFVSFQRVVDAVGPVSFYFPTPVRDPYTALNVTQAGCASLDGPKALALVRSRHLEYLQDGRWREDPTDDRGRMVRQQDFLRRVVQLAASRGLTNPAKLNQLVGSIAPSLTVDSGFGTSEMGRLGRRFAASGPSALTWSVLPVLDDKVDGQDVERLDQPAADAVLAAFGGSARGTLATGRSTTSTGKGRTATSGTALGLPADLSVRIVGSLSAPAAAEMAREDLAAAGIPVTVALAGRLPSTRVRISAPRQAESAAATLAGLVPGARAVVDPSLPGTSVVMVVGATWPGLLTARSTGGGATAPPPSSTTSTTASITTTTIPAKGTDDKVSCP